MQIDHSGKNVIVTGASSGIGKSIAIILAESGAHIFAADLDIKNAEITANEIRSRNLKCTALKVNISNESDVNKMVEIVENKTKGSIDAIVNCAAILIPPKPFYTISEKEWDSIYSVDVKGTFLCSKAVAPIMIKNNKGVIINIGSVAGKIQRMDMAAYCSAKAAVIHMTKVMAFELGKHNVRAISLCPGTTGTKMVMETITGGDPEKLQSWLSGIPLGKFAETEDHAYMVSFLISDYAKHITGQAINVDGGQVMW